MPLAVTALALAMLAPRLAGAVEQAELPACEVVDVALIDTIDSARAKAGDAFRFKTLSDVPAGAMTPALPKDTTGYGLVMGAHHAGRGGRPGHLIVDTRFLLLGDGTHLAATFLPRSHYDAPVMDGSPANAPGYIGIIPFASVMTGAYNTVHYGKEIVLGSGTKFRVVVGDALALGQCRLPPENAPSPSPSPSPRPDATPPPAHT